MKQAPPPGATSAPLDKSACYLFENMIKEHGQKYVVDMGRENTPAGHLVRRFLKQERRMTFVYSHGTWYSGLDVVPGPSPLITMSPVLGARDVPKRPNTQYIDKLARDKGKPKGFTYVRDTATPLATPRKRARAKVERVLYMGFMLPKDLVDTLKAQFKLIEAQAMVATP
jgi:hypothetical protein